MKILVCGSAQNRDEICSGIPVEKSDVVFAEKWDDVQAKDQFDAFYILNECKVEKRELERDKPVFINEVISTLTEMDAPANVIRINGWPGFIKRGVWEVSGNITEQAKAAAAILGKELVVVKDTPGLIAATIVCMVINEAYYALQEGLSSREEIDIAMKAATNYPYGPFEWGEMIGWNKVFHLLKRLSETDDRYTPSFTPNLI